MDEIDFAQERSDFLFDQMLKNHRRRLQTPSRQTCKDCGEPISKARQQAMPGCTRCILCQRSVERMPNKRLQ